MSNQTATDSLKNMLRTAYRLVMPVPVQRALLYLRFNKNGKLHKNTSDTADIFEWIYENNVWGKDKSQASGPGSSIDATENIRNALPRLWEKYQVKTFLDVPCGDYHWMKLVNKKGIFYTGGDVVREIVKNHNQQYRAENVAFEWLDITAHDLPKVDMVFCRDCLQHLSYANVFKALNNFKKSNSTYLLTTSFPKTWFNWDICDGGYRPLNLRKRPFKLPVPLEIIYENSSFAAGIDKCMYLYRLKDIHLEEHLNHGT